MRDFTFSTMVMGHYLTWKGLLFKFSSVLTYPKLSYLESFSEGRNRGMWMWLPHILQNVIFRSSERFVYHLKQSKSKCKFVKFFLENWIFICQSTFIKIIHPNPSQYSKYVHSNAKENIFYSIVLCSRPT